MDVTRRLGVKEKARPSKYVLSTSLPVCFLFPTLLDLLLNSPTPTIPVLRALLWTGPAGSDRCWLSSSTWLCRSSCSRSPSSTRSSPDVSSDDVSTLLSDSAFALSLKRFKSKLILFVPRKIRNLTEMSRRIRNCHYHCVNACDIGYVGRLRHKPSQILCRKHYFEQNLVKNSSC